jgi:uncharacterized protein (DUF2236 family)
MRDVGTVMAQPTDGFDARDLLNGAGLLAATANVVMQLSRPEVGYGVLESTVDRAQVMRHPLRRWRVTLTYLAAALAGTPAEREACRRAVNRSHAQVHSTPDSPARYSAFDPQLQLWIAACLYRGTSDVQALLAGPADEQTAEAIYRAASRLGTTLQMPAGLWPSDRAAFDRYWDTALAAIRIDPPVRAYLHQLIMLRYLPAPLSAALGPVNRFFTTGFLPPPFREQMQLPWTGRDQRQFESVIHVIAAINRLLPGPVRRFPFNACLLGLRARTRWDRTHRPAPRDRATPPARPAQGQPGTKPQPPASVRAPGRGDLPRFMQATGAPGWSLR